ncbi:MAG: 4-hydroxybenzoate octaprenyltransferase [Maricaulaceae bacterium]
MPDPGSPSLAAKPADAAPRNWVDTRAPESWRPFLRLARFDRPIGFWLLALPCWIGLGLARLDGGLAVADLGAALAYGVGAVAMRGAGCTYNDIVDKDLDAQVARTAQRPLACGALSVRGAWGFLAAQLAVAFLVWLSLPLAGKTAALAAVPLVAAYPFMKRITWWPQAWLGLTFNWGVLVGFVSAHGAVTWSLGLVYAGLALWTVGYDTLYAIQDKEDDALIGVKSTARLFGDRVRLGVGLAYAGAVGCISAGVALAAGADLGLMALALASVVGFALALGRQVARASAEDGPLALTLFRSNREAGLVLAVGWAVAALWAALI